MKKIILLTGITLIVALAGVWGYLMFFSTSNGDNGDLFALFGFGDTTDNTVSFEEFNTPQVEEPVVDVVGPEPLRQLTTRPVVGYSVVFLTPSSSPLVYFAEAGTGHIYSVDLFSGAESRISNITIPSAQKASFSNDGKRAAVKSGTTNSGDLHLITLPAASTTLSSSVLSESGDNFSFSESSELLYTLQTNNATVGKVYNAVSDSTRTLFELPFREMVVDWGEDVDAVHFAYPKSSGQLEGALYKIEDGSLSRLPASGYGFSAVSTDGYSLYSLIEGGAYRTKLLNHETGESTQVQVSLIPEKCSYGLFEFICGHSDSVTEDLPDDWHQGVYISDENLISVSLDTAFPSQIINFNESLGRVLEVQNIQTNKIGELFLFTNKSSGYLWLYDSNVMF